MLIFLYILIFVATISGIAGLVIAGPIASEDYKGREEEKVRRLGGLISLASIGFILFNCLYLVPSQKKADKTEKKAKPISTMLKEVKEKVYQRGSLKITDRTNKMVSDTIKKGKEEAIKERVNKCMTAASYFARNKSEEAYLRGRCLENLNAM